MAITRIHSHSYIKAAVSILQSYNGSEPFRGFLKKYFSKHKKHGSNDRKFIASLCYSYFRLGHAIRNIPIEERILLSAFLYGDKYAGELTLFKPANQIIEKNIVEKLIDYSRQFAVTDIFPYEDELSEGIDREKFNISFLIQPKLFLRIRPGKKPSVNEKLATSIQHTWLTEECVAFPNGTKVQAIIELDKDAVVQDYNSQQTGEFIKLAIGNLMESRSVVDVWDCCVASGGKSIMAYDINQNIRITVSDKRSSILEICKQRFEKAGIRDYEAFVADLSQQSSGSGLLPDIQQPGAGYELIIADVPCTGSGTWSRSPEQLYYFDKASIEKYSRLQKQILGNVIPKLKPGGHLLYITCSVFKKENEEIVNYLQQSFSLNLVKMELLKGYEMQADTMFAALFQSIAINY